jgi:hypothetical protein
MTKRTLRSRVEPVTSGVQKRRYLEKTIIPTGPQGPGDLIVFSIPKYIKVGFGMGDLVGSHSKGL